MAEAHPNPLDHWRHRRRIAYVGVLGILLTLLAVVLDRIPEHLLELAQSLVWVFSLLVLGYIANNAVEAFANRGKP